MNIKPLVYDTYMALIFNSEGSRLWLNNYALVDGVKKDVTKNGELSCAYYVSFVLANFGLIKRHHTTITSTIKDMEESGWQKTDEPKPGDVILWGPKESVDDDGVEHNHLGFYLGDEKAMTNNYVRSRPDDTKVEKIDYLYRDHPDGKRPIQAIYTGKHLFKS